MSFYSGDSHLSGVDMRLWSLVADVLHRWQTLVIFKHVSLDVRDGRRELVSFFVPGDATFRDEITAYLEQELASMRRADMPADREGTQPGDIGHGFPGTDVVIDIQPFSGVVPYITEAEGKRLVQEALSTFMQRLKRDEKSRPADSASDDKPPAEDPRQTN